jgi:branched-chain amino acid transport system permease protein
VVTANTAIRSRYINTRYEDDLQLVRTWLKRGWMCVCAVLIVGFPIIANRYTTHILCLVAIAAIGAVGLNFITGFTGQISLAHGAFVGIGAYSVTILSTRLGLSFWIAAPLAAVITGLLGLIVAVPALRLKGLYLAIATLAIHFLAEQSMMNLESLTGGFRGLDVPAPRLGPITVKTESQFYYLTMATSIAALLFATNVARGRFGRAFAAIRDRDLAAEAVGISVTRFKAAALFLGSVYAGLAGALLAVTLGRIAPYNFTLITSIEYLSMIIVGGLGSVLGSVFGAIAMTLLPFSLVYLTDTISAVWPGFALRFADAKIMVYGLLIMLFLIFEPEGLAGVWRRVKVYFRQWPFTY